LLVIAEEAQGGGNLRRHHPRKRMIQYAERYEFFIGACDYWIPAFAGMTAIYLLSAVLSHKGRGKVRVLVV
jgi:hypothetical protein